MTLERTHSLTEDQKWLPWHLRYMSYLPVLVAVAILMGLTLPRLAQLGVPSRILIGASIFFSVGLAFGFTAFRRYVQRRWVHMVHDEIALRPIGEWADGERVHIRGRILAVNGITSVIQQSPCVYRRVTFSFPAHSQNESVWIHEAAEDFVLVDEWGEQIRVEVAQSRLIAPSSKGKLAAPDLAARLVLYAESVRGRVNLFQSTLAVLANEFFLSDGDHVDIVGCKNRYLDPSISMRLDRETPMRVVLRGNSAQPLLIAPAQNIPTTP